MVTSTLKQYGWAILVYVVALGLLLWIVTGCGQSERFAQHQVSMPDSSNTGNLNNVVIHGVSIIQLTSDGNGRIRASNASQNQSITITNNAVSAMTLSPYSQPSANTSTALTVNVDFGSLVVATLFDNNINVCGVGNNQHCGTAGFRIYNQTNNGMINGSDATNLLPLLGKPVSSVLTGFGIAVAGSLSLQTITIPNSKHNVKLTDFSPSPSYDIQADFSNAGSGTYSGTVVLEYFLQ